MEENWEGKVKEWRGGGGGERKGKGEREGRRKGEGSAVSWLVGWVREALSWVGGLGEGESEGKRWVCGNEKKKRKRKQRAD